MLHTTLTALHWAARTGHLEVARALLLAKGEVDARDKDGWTPLHWAASVGDRSVAELLLAYKAAVSATASDGTTPLHWAADKGHSEVAKALLARAAQVNVEDSGGQTPLHWAARAGHNDVVTLLISSKANINHRDHKGATALDYAEDKKHEDVALFLCMKGGQDRSKSCVHLVQPVVVAGKLDQPFGLSVAGPSISSLWIESSSRILGRGWPCLGGSKPICYKVLVIENTKLPSGWRNGNFIEYKLTQTPCTVRGNDSGVVVSSGNEMLATETDTNTVVSGTMQQ